MIEKELDIATADGRMNTFICYPDENEPFPVVFFYMDAPGKREELHDMARRIAAVGYFVVLPNLYYRRTPDYWLKERTESAMAVMFEHMRATTTALIMRDTQAMLEFVDAQPQANASKIGAVGYCMSGPFVMGAAATFPDRINCILSIHGAGMFTQAPDSPHLFAPKIRCESYFACAETDKWAPPSDIDALEKALKQAKVPYRIEWYPKSEHGFVFPQRAVFHKPSAERHWVRLFDIFERNLRH